MIRQAIMSSSGFFTGCIIFSLLTGQSLMIGVERGFFGAFAVLMFAWVNHKNYVSTQNTVKNEKNTKKISK